MAKPVFKGRVIAHVDMDAFYASVEVHDDETLRGLPVVVGGPAEKRGVVAAASYEARKFGVHSAMPMGRAQSLCPDLVRISPRMARYRDVSVTIMGILKGFSPLVEPLSLDEAFVDLTGTERSFGPPEQAGEQIRAAIRAETGLTASVGIAPNKFLAKLASDERKPDGLTLVTAETAVEFVQGQPIERIWGVGEKMAGKLHRLGLHRARDIAQAEPSFLKRHFGLMGLRLYELSWGRDDRPVVPETEAKSVSHEVTFAKNQKHLELLRGVLSGLCQQTARRLRRAHLVGRTVNLKIRYGDFTTVTRQEALGHPTDDDGEIYGAAARLLEVERAVDGRPVRLLGVGVTGLLRQTQMNLDLFGGPGGGSGEGSAGGAGGAAGGSAGGAGGGAGGGSAGGAGGGAGGAAGGSAGGAGGGASGSATGGEGSHATKGGGSAGTGASGGLGGASGGSSGASVPSPPRDRSSRPHVAADGGRAPGYGSPLARDLADGGAGRREALNAALDHLADRFGPDAVRRARALPGEKIEEERAG